MYGQQKRSCGHVLANISKTSTAAQVVMMVCIYSLTSQDKFQPVQELKQTGRPQNYHSVSMPFGGLLCVVCKLVRELIS